MDVGSGKCCPYAKANRCSAAKCIGIDVARDELVANTDVDMKVVTDVALSIPLKDGCVGLVSSRSVLEHLRDTDVFFAESKRVLTKGGLMVHVMPSKYAPFALMNRILPDRLGRSLLTLLKPEQKGICGFPAVYDQCSYSQILKLINKHDLALVGFKTSFYQSRYYDFFLPVFLLSAAYDFLLFSLGIKRLSAYLLLVARKK